MPSLPGAGRRLRTAFSFCSASNLLEEHTAEIARLITQENGKTLAESKAELQRSIENVEVACGIPSLMQGYNLEDVASGIDEIMIRQPLGVVAAITPFNFPAMVPLWFLPYAIACGNTFILKPSERVPLTARRIFELLHQTALPKGVVNLVVGAKPAVDALLKHPDVRAISFVGSTAVAKYVYTEGSAAGKRVQCQGGAKNHVVILPDADFEMTAKVVSDSAFGCAGQRCLAVSTAITVADASKSFAEAIVTQASSLRVGNGLDADVQMGPVISEASKARIERLIGAGLESGGKALLDGRNPQPRDHGYFLNPTVLAQIAADDDLTTTEIFGPVLTLQEARELDDAILSLRINQPELGVNIGVAAPMAYFPFSGWKDSFLGVMHGQGRDAVEFYTDKKVVVERWPKEWSRKF